MKKDKKECKIIFNEKKFFLLLFFIFLLIALFTYDPKPALGGDNIHYLLLSRSLISFKGYRDLWHPKEKPHTQYPFGFPLLIIPFLLIFGENSLFLNFLPLLFFIGSFFLVKRIFQESKWRFLLISLFFLSPLVIENSHVLLSEPPFIFFSLLTFYLFILYEKKKNFKFFILFIFSAIFTFFIRTAGISLILAIFLYLFTKKRYKFLIIALAIFLLAFISWEIRNRKIEEKSSYLQQFLQKDPYQPELGNINFPEYLGRVFKNFYIYNFIVIPQIFYLNQFPPLIWQTIIGILTILSVIIAFLNLIKEKNSLNKLILYYFIFSSFIIFSWPEVWSSERFLFPFFIFLIYFILIGSEKFFIKSSLSFLIYPLLFLVFLFYLIRNLQMIKENLPNTIKNFSGDKYAGYPIDWQNYFKALEWIRDNTEEKAIVISRKPEFTYFISKRKSLLYEFSSNPEEVLKKILINKADYLLYDNFYWTGTSQKYLLPVLKIYPQYFQLVYKTKPPEMIVFKIQK
ncbi:MAG: hypothetical protein N2323_05115 [candidate division WOR-3 bacterium]|nr:hypothetical protein [candidate division WOR-3 bacterium]MCX7837320.1 hypothetical protein [candidate division WOR-3 bacterium]